MQFGVNGILDPAAAAASARCAHTPGTRVATGWSGGRGRPRRDAGAAHRARGQMRGAPDAFLTSCATATRSSSTRRWITRRAIPSGTPDGSSRATQIRAVRSPPSRSGTVGPVPLRSTCAAGTQRSRRSRAPTSSPVCASVISASPPTSGRAAVRPPAACAAADLRTRACPPAALASPAAARRPRVPIRYTLASVSASRAKMSWLASLFAASSAATL